MPKGCAPPASGSWCWMCCRSNPGHLDAEAIHDQVKIQDPRISLATVYRTLALLKRLGLVAEHSLGEDHGHFEAASAAPHYHFTCLRCKRVIEFEAPAVMQIVRKLAEQEGLQVTETHLTLSGYCRDCRPTRRQVKCCSNITAITMTSAWTPRASSRAATQPAASRGGRPGRTGQRGSRAGQPHRLPGLHPRG